MAQVRSSLLQGMSCARNVEGMFSVSAHFLFLVILLCTIIGHFVSSHKVDVLI